jgi:hypothetical protein
MRALSTCIALGVTLLAASAARAADGCCDLCGCNCCVQKFCVCKKIEKEITKTCWDVKCEDVCIPGCSECCGEVCKQDECGCWSFKLWKPACATCIKTRHIPVKTEVKRKVPSYEWKVEYRCVNCCGGACGKGCGAPCADAAQAAAPAAAASAPAPMVTNPAVPYNVAETPSARRK